MNQQNPAVMFLFSKPQREQHGQQDVERSLFWGVRNCHNVFLCFERSRIAAYQCILSLCLFVLCVFMHTEISNLLL